MLKLTLPFPSKELSPNARIHWAKKQRFKKEQFDAGYYEAYPHRGCYGTCDLPLRIEFYPPNNRRRDSDNASASCKAGIDGIAKGLGINDRQFKQITVTMCQPDKENPHAVFIID